MLFSKKHSTQCTVNCLLKAFGLYIFVRGFRRVYNRRGLYPRGFITEVEKALSEQAIGSNDQTKFCIYCFTLASKLHNKSNSFKYKLEREGGLTSWGTYDWEYFLFTWRWVYNWGGGGGKLVSGSLRYVTNVND